jgi:FAD/FMN-containing dehydrogenase
VSRGAPALLTDLRARAAYSEGAGIYRVLPEAVAVPRDATELTGILQWARDSGKALVPRGAGSGMPGGNVGRGLILDMSRGFDALEVDPRRRLARAGASVTWAQVDQAARVYGLRLPPDPSSGAFATSGGMASTNAAGPRSMRYGSVRRWISAIEVVGADGQTQWIRRGQSGSRFRPEAATLQRAVKSFPRTHKNSSGYALDAFAESGDEVDLFIGAEGTLGVLTAVEWQLDPVPPDAAGVALGFADLGALGEAVPFLLALNPSAVELLDRTLLDFANQAGSGSSGVPEGTDCLLLVEFERESAPAARGVVGDAVRGLKHLTRHVETAVDRTGLEGLWSIRHRASPALARLPETRRSLQVVEDGCVPVDRLADYVVGLRAASDRHEIPVAIFGHAGDANVHVNALPDLTRARWEESLHAFYDEVQGLVARLGGTASGEHGDGRLRSGVLDRFFGPDALALFRDLKRAYDPHAVFNPGVILPAAHWAPLADLKVGPGAAAIPDDIAAGLRHIERTGGWATPKLDLVRSP